VVPRRRELATNMVVTGVACLIALWPSYDGVVGLAIQVGVDRVAATCAPLARTAASGTAAIRSAPLAGTVT
jgi:hypothetical protein